MEDAEVPCDELAILHQGHLAVGVNPINAKTQNGENTCLDDVFVHFSGVIIEHGGLPISTV